MTTGVSADFQDDFATLDEFYTKYSALDEKVVGCYETIKDGFADQQPRKTLEAALARHRLSLVAEKSFQIPDTPQLEPEGSEADPNILACKFHLFGVGKKRDIGIDVHHPKFGAWLDTLAHRELHNASRYNDIWDRFILGRKKTQSFRPGMNCTLQV